MQNIDIAYGLFFQELNLRTESYDDRLISQKKVYLLQEMGINTNFRFFMRKGAPFSWDLANYLYLKYELLKPDFKKEAEKKNIHLKDNAVQVVAAMNDLAEQRPEKTSTTYWYEILTATHFIRKYWKPESLYSAVRRSLPGITRNQFQAAEEALKKLEETIARIQLIPTDSSAAVPAPTPAVSTRKPSLEVKKYINDPVYGGIPVTELEMELINLPIFQRLRNLRQLSRVSYAFPGAEHSRFVHSLGVLYITGLMTDHLREKYKNDKDVFTEKDCIKMRVAALLHDIGHYPLSHYGENVYGYCEDKIHKEENNTSVTGHVVGLPDEKKHQLYHLASAHSSSAHHEFLGKYLVMHHNDILAVLHKYGLDPQEIGEIFTGEIGLKNMVYNQLLHSSLDADRLDYLLRDSFQTGVTYGKVDLQYLVRLLMIVKDGSAGNVLVCKKKGQHVVEHYLMARYFHYAQVVFHKTNGAFEGLTKILYLKLVMAKRFMYHSLDDIHQNINEESFLHFTDAQLEAAWKNYYDDPNNTDEEFKTLYRMYINRKRPKMILELKDLYEGKEGREEFKNLVKILEDDPEQITKILGSDVKWFYQMPQLRIEKIDHFDPNGNLSKKEMDAVREAVKLYDEKEKKLSYLGADKLSVAGLLSGYTCKFIRIYVFDEEDKLRSKYEQYAEDIRKLIKPATK